MKLLKLFIFFSLISFISCSTVKVTTDYDTQVNFNQYKTFAFYKKGIDKTPISDLDKRRIMRAIETELLAKGMTKSENPDLLVSLYTKSRTRVDVNYNRYMGYYYPWYYGRTPVNVSKYTEGTLFVDLIDPAKKQMVWQGIGSGYLSYRSAEKKENRIREFVAEIMAKYPPENQQK